jgi:putative pyruvate formate lyase activating enzyme
MTSPHAAWPAYLGLSSAELRARAERAVALLEDCRICPRDCGVNRLENRWAACKTGRHAVVSSAFPHLGEEDCLRGWAGSGTIFFTHCNLRCVFCQNWDISQAVKPGHKGDPASTASEIAAMMIALQEHGCHNINFVTPEHVVPQVVEALDEAIGRGLRLPLVYNTSGYDSLDSIDLMDGLVDIYMPDFKFWSAAASKRYMMAADYPEAARAAIRAMHRQVGALSFDDDGLARRGVLIRHLVMPGCLDETRAVLGWIAEELGTDTYVNLMDQYRPAGKVTAEKLPEIARRPSSAELGNAYRIAADLGLRRLDERRPHPRLLRRMLSPR